MAPDPKAWLLTPFFPNNGKPWGTGTKMNERARATPDAPWDTGCKVMPLIGGYRAMCAMRDVLDDLATVALANDAKPADERRLPGDRGHVYIAGWRLNPIRDLSDQNVWKTDSWANTPKTPPPAQSDQTAIGLILRLMQAGVAVRILVWLPTLIESIAAELGPHVTDHHYLSNIIRAENDRLQGTLNPTRPLGVVGLDARTTEGALSGAHHQKMMVIRSPLPPGKVDSFNVAFVGGVDLAFTRRDAPASPPADWTTTTVGFFDGDWQSGSGLANLPMFTNPNKPSTAMPWPPDGKTDYSSVGNVSAPTDPSQTDLPIETDSAKDVCSAVVHVVPNAAGQQQLVAGKWAASGNAGSCTYTLYAVDQSGKPVLDNNGQPTGTETTSPHLIYDKKQIWHDQHLKLWGPIVTTLEWQFAERWIDSPDAVWKPSTTLVGQQLEKVVDLYRGLVHVSTTDALDKNGNVLPLPDPQDEPAVSGATSTVQMWRTIPMRDSRSTDLFKDGEFTVMAGYANAMSTAQELIWIFDQYFWSEAVARLLNQRVRNSQDLCVIVVLPPFADSTCPEIHLARMLALEELMKGLNAVQKDRIAVYNLWAPQIDSSQNPPVADKSKGRGIYVHAKTQTYDGTLLVCGSANLNRRSLMCDSEIACAVLDPDLVTKHQQDLWTLLFGQTIFDWPNLDLNTPGNGIAFLRRFQGAADSEFSFLVPDPDISADDVFGTKPATIPNGVARRAVFPGPTFQFYYGEGLDPLSIDRGIEQDVIDTPGTPPRPPRLDDIVDRVEKKAQVAQDGSLDYEFRKQGSRLVGPMVTWPGKVYTEGPPHNYEFTENAEWWKQACLGFPCSLALGWPGYGTKIVEATDLGPTPVVIQLWKGWCEQLASLKGMPGGVGAEVGVYRRIPNLAPPDSLPDELGEFGVEGLTMVTKGSKDIWWPYPELDPTIKFTLTNVQSGQEFFSNGDDGEETWWACKWMTPDSYGRYQTDSPPAPGLLDLSSIVSSYTLDYTITCTVNGQTFTHTDSWAGS